MHLSAAYSSKSPHLTLTKALTCAQEAVPGLSASSSFLSGNGVLPRLGNLSSSDSRANGALHCKGGTRVVVLCRTAVRHSLAEWTLIWRLCRTLGWRQLCASCCRRRPPQRTFSQASTLCLRQLQPSPIAAWTGVGSGDSSCSKRSWPSTARLRSSGGHHTLNS